LYLTGTQFNLYFGLLIEAIIKSLLLGVVKSNIKLNLFSNPVIMAIPLPLPYIYGLQYFTPVEDLIN